MSETPSSDITQKFIFWISTAAITVMLGVGTPIYSSIQSQFSDHQDQIKDNQSKIWEQQRTSVTEEALSRRVAEIMQMVDTKIEGIQSLQREQTRQLTLLLESQKEFQRDVRNSLKEKANK